MQGVPRKIVLLRQPALLPKNTALTPRELVLLFPRLPKLTDSSIVLIPPGDLQEETHWKIPTLNGSSIYLVNL